MELITQKLELLKGARESVKKEGLTKGEKALKQGIINKLSKEVERLRNISSKTLLSKTLDLFVKNENKLPQKIRDEYFASLDENENAVMDFIFSKYTKEESK